VNPAQSSPPANEKQDDWAIENAFGHASRSMNRSKLDVMIPDIGRKWVSTDEALLQDSISVVKTTENVLGDIDHVVVPYVLKCGSMTYKHQDDYDRLEVLKKTSDVQWNTPRFDKSNFFYHDVVGIHHYLHNDLIGNGASTRLSTVSGTPSRSALMRTSVCPAPLDLTESSYVRRDVTSHSTFRGDGLAKQCPPFRGADENLPADSTLRWMIDLIWICVPIWIHLLFTSDDSHIEEFFDPPASQPGVPWTGTVFIVI